MKLDRSHRSKALSTVGDDDADEADDADDADDVAGADDSGDDEAPTCLHLQLFISSFGTR